MTAPDDLSPGVEVTWPTVGQEQLFDIEVFYDRSADPAQPWNVAPGLGDDLGTDDDVHAWGLMSRGVTDGDTGWGVAS